MIVFLLICFSSYLVVWFCLNKTCVKTIMSLSCQKMWATKRWKHPVFVEENPQPTDQEMEWTQSFSKANCHCTFWHNFWNSCFVSGTHAQFYTWFVLVSYGFQCKLWMGVDWRPAAPLWNHQGLQNVLMKLAVLELWFGIQLNNHSELSVFAVGFFVVPWCFVL